MKLCSIEGCGRKHVAHSYCEMHARRFRKHGDPLVAGEKTGRPPKGEHPGFHAVHKRLHRQRGAASLHRCVDCGGFAREWSYNGNDPAELVGRSGRFEMHYSLDLSFYEPRCVSCHRKFDGAGNRERNSKGQFSARKHYAEEQCGVRIVIRELA